MVTQAVERLLERDVPVQIVTPVAAHATQSFALYHPLDADAQPVSLGAGCRYRFGKIEASGEKKRRPLSCLGQFLALPLMEGANVSA